ncbi:hypothetical protein NAT51_08135 [Flavobacterium amniphilum]|uniref:hypothetical protein n=1 Tax=Flavobacterium amniphilum TaxID=1834035 RepID=UPI00202A6E81|nr:hypothetical protein [Flavobacterium amniphilum]MCL9805487.1 hypothetical protein [Flavobacterium amniphilum]
MKLNHDEFTEAAFLFEKENRRLHSEFENGIIENSRLKTIPANELEADIIYGIKKGIYETEAERVNAYWALSKRNNKKLVPDFRTCLQTELEAENPIAVFQILVALDLLNEPSFAPERDSLDVNETELNINDAKNYLGKQSQSIPGNPKV